MSASLLVQGAGYVSELMRLQRLAPTYGWQPTAWVAQFGGICSSSSRGQQNPTRGHGASAFCAAFFRAPLSRSEHPPVCHTQGAIKHTLFPAMLNTQPPCHLVYH